MARAINFNFRTGGGSGVEVLHGQLSFAPTRVWENGSTTILATPTVVGIANGMASLTNVEASPGGDTPEWAYRVEVKDSITRKTWSWLVGVPDGTAPIDFTELPQYAATLPPGGSAEALQNYAAQAQDGAARAEAAAAQATAPTEQMVASLIGSPDSLPHTAISDIVDSRTGGLGAADNKSFTVKRVSAAGGNPAHAVTVISNGLTTRDTAVHVNAFDSTQAIVTERESLSSMYSRTRANIIMNGSGWWPGDGRRVGLTIHNGSMIQDWEPLPQADWGVEAFVFYRDGTARVEDRSTPGATLLANGAWNSISFGKAAIRGGADQGLASNPKYEGITGRQAIGITPSKQIVILSFPGTSGMSGATIQQVLAVAAPYGFVDLYLNDGGGSTQLMMNGTYVVASSDAGGQRPVPDALCFYASPANSLPIDTDWQALTLTGGAVRAGAGDENKYRVRLMNGEEEVIVRVGMTGIGYGQSPFTLPADAWPKYIRPGIVASNSGALAYFNIGADGKSTVFGTGFDAAKVARGEFRFYR